jgi:hypothetical protein
VREPDFWAKREIKNLIEQILGFLSNDKYSFSFELLKQDRRNQPYFKFGDQAKWPFHSPDRVVMFSGGLDSLAGAVETAASGGKLVLVSHRPVSTMDSRQRNLFVALQKQFPAQSLRIPVWINKKKSLGNESTQRTRSFLFTALGALVAHSIQAEGVRFYENGVVSLNLPVSQEALRARASRTTHPLALHLLASLCTSITGRNLAIDNPYIFKTKAEVVASLATHHAEGLIPLSCSCARTMFKPNLQRHCGQCSQCIDRRFAMAGANLLAYDPATDYASDVFIGPRIKDLDKAIAVDYAVHGVELHRHADAWLAATYSAEIARAVRYEGNRDDAARKLIAMHKRHGDVIARVLREKVNEYSAQLVERSLEKTSLLALFIGQSFPQERTESLHPEQISPDSGASCLGSVSTETQLARIERKVDAILSRTDSPTLSTATSSMKRGKPTKRDTFLFAGILRELTGIEYCQFLDNHKVKPKWSHDGPSTYVSSYARDDRFCKKVQDEKSRARQRMDSHANSALAEAFVTYIPDEFEQLSQLLNSRNSRRASPNLAKPATA